ncbi:hypothetical protein PM082_013206 [Marasmius tenuissimus]|nr:hypothetical protein PM082_013206 [Marasmius tenuissimus]
MPLRSTPFPFLLVLLGKSFTAIAQDTEPATCSDSSQSLNWTSNSLGQDPCQVASILGGVCSPAGFVVPPLDTLPNSTYKGPEEGKEDGCRCSSVFYSLPSACAACQGGDDWLSWSEFSKNCFPPYNKTFMEIIPGNTKVPAYAYVLDGDSFSLDVAQEESAGLPESVGPGPSSTLESSHSPSSTTPLNSTTPSSTAQSHDKPESPENPNTGAIVGGIIGGLVALCSLVILVFTFLRRRRTQLAPSTVFSLNQRANDTGAWTGRGSYARVYDPQDPTSFPPAPYFSPSYKAAVPLQPNRPRWYQT